MREFVFKNKVLVLHLSFWVLYFSYRFYDVQEYLGYKRALLYLPLAMAFNIVASYYHYFLILPEWFKTKKLFPYFLKIVVLLAIVVTLRILVENEFLPGLMGNEKYYQSVKLSRVISTIWDTMSFMIFTGMIRFTLEWFDLENKKKQLENQNLIAELNFLKAQINPHFLFNTLHNLNYLVYARSEKATEVIIKLSNIMRYMIYDAKKDCVPLKKEIDYMNDYIHLERIRLNQDFILNFEISGNVGTVEIAPLIMLTFLENAFKHGVSDSATDCRIDVELRSDERLIYFDVANKKLQNTNQKLKSGFGLENVKKRLQLSYPDKHTLTIIDDRENYRVSLTLDRS